MNSVEINENAFLQEVPVPCARRSRRRRHGAHRRVHPPLPGILRRDPAPHVEALLNQLMLLSVKSFCDADMITCRTFPSNRAFNNVTW